MAAEIERQDDLVALLGKMVVGEPRYGQWRGSKCGDYFVKCGRQVTGPCPSTGWEQWASSEIAHWLSEEPDAIARLLECMCDPGQFLSSESRVLSEKRREQVARWNGWLAPFGWSIEATDTNIAIRRISPQYLPDQQAPSVPPTRTAAATAPDWSMCPFDGKLTRRINARWRDYLTCVEGGAYVPAIVMLGSMLEAALLAAIKELPKEANLAKAALKKDGNAVPFIDWKLDRLLTVANEIGLLERSRRDFASSLRDWRNIVHLRHEVEGDYVADKHTVDICEMVLRGVVADLGARDWTGNK